jgi:hypothetical protein
MLPFFKNKTQANGLEQSSLTLLVLLVLKVRSRLTCYELHTKIR